jgi:hypothetical protein
VPAMVAALRCVGVLPYPEPAGGPAIQKIRHFSLNATHQAAGLVSQAGLTWGAAGRPGLVVGSGCTWGPGAG